MTTRKATQDKATPEVAPEVTPEAPAETPAQTFARESAEHVAWLTSVRERAYQWTREHGICSGGLHAFLRDTGIPFNDAARNATSPSQPVITDPGLPEGFDVSWLTDDAVSKALEVQRKRHADQRALIGAGIRRGEASGYYGRSAADAVLAELGLTGPNVPQQATIGMRYLTVDGIPGDVPAEKVAEAFAKIMTAAVEMYLPGTYGKLSVQPPEVTLRTNYDDNNAPSPSGGWSF